MRSAAEAEAVAAVFTGVNEFNAKKARRKADVYRHAVSPSLEDRVTLATRQTTRPEILDLLADDENNWVAHQVAENPSTPPDTLERFWKASRFDQTLAENPATPPEILARYLNSGDVKLMRPAATNPSTPGYALSFAVESKEDHPTRAAAITNPSCPPETLSLVVAVEGDYSATAADALRNPNYSPVELETVALGGSEYLAKAALENPSCPMGVLRRVAYDDESSSGLMAAVARNPSVAEDRPLLWRAAERCPWSPAAVTAGGNADTPVRVFAAIAENGQNKSQCAVAANPACPPDVLFDLPWETDPMVALRIARNPNAGPVLLKRLQNNAKGKRSRQEAREAIRNLAKRT